VQTQNIRFGQKLQPLPFLFRTLLILYQLKDGPLRFNHLKIRVQDAVVDYDDSDNLLSNKVLSMHLSELVEFGLLTKIQNNTHTCYCLTDKGASAILILLDLFYWGSNEF
jgi:DNA-binding HxlR family transcriptional regulator